MWAEKKPIPEIATAIGRVGKGDDPYHALRVSLTKMHKGYRNAQGVSGDDALLSSLTEELESRDFEVLPTHFGDGGLSLFKKDGPFAFMLADYWFIPSKQIKDCMQLMIAIHLINRFQQMAIMFVDSAPIETSDHSNIGGCCMVTIPTLRKIMHATSPSGGVRSN